MPATLAVTNLESSNGARVAWTTTPINYDMSANDPVGPGYPGLGRPGEGRCSRRVVCGGAGTLAYVGLDGVTVVLPSTAAGQIWDIQMQSLLAAGTTATNVVVQW